jgi:hypothetical protein
MANEKQLAGIILKKFSGKVYMIRVVLFTKFSQLAHNSETIFGKLYT